MGMDHNLYWFHSMGCMVYSYGDAMNSPLIDYSAGYPVIEWDGLDYLLGDMKPNYPLPAIPEIHQWDYSLWSMLVNTPPMTDEEWEREEDEWQDYLDTLE